MPSSLGIKILISKISLMGESIAWLTRKNNNIIVLSGDEFMPEMHLCQSSFPNNKGFFATNILRINNIKNIK